MSTEDIFFMQCQNPKCELRFPLDLAQFGGKFCPRCGGELSKDIPRVASQSFQATINSPRRLIAVLDNLRSAHNVGSIFRSADGAAFSHLHLGGITPKPDTNHAIAKTALGAESLVPWSYNPNTPDLLKQLKNDGATLLVLESVPQAQSLYALDSRSIDLKQDLVLVVGNEPAGVDPKIISLADQCLYIPMLGKKDSLNVAIAFSIAAYHLRFGLLS